MKLLLFLAVLVFSVFGLCEFLHLFKLFLIFPRRKMCSTLVVMLDEPTACRQIIFAGEQLKWLGDKFTDRVIAVGEDLKAETAEECQSLADRYGIKFVVKGKG